MIISDILLFVRISETLSFKEAAKHLSISRSQASKRIAALEDELGTPLIYRSPRSISLTNAGETLLEHYRHIFQMMEEARLAVEQLSSVPVGRLRFSMPTCVGAIVLPKLHGEFLPRYPGVVLDAHISDTYVDIVAGGYDVVIRVAQKLSDSTLTARSLATSPLVLAAAPSYLLEHGSPSHAAQLTQQRCLGLQGGKQLGTTWQFRASNERLSVPVNFWAVSDNNLALVRAACSGLGFIYVPKAVVANELRQGTLQAVLPELCRGVEWGIYAVHSGRSPTKNAAALIDFVRDALPAVDGVDCKRPLPPRVVAMAEQRRDGLVSYQPNQDNGNPVDQLRLPVVASIERERPCPVGAGDR